MTTSTLNIDALFQQGDWEAVAALSSRDLASNTTRSNPARLLALLCVSLYALGRRHEALAGYARYSKTLSKSGDREELTWRTTAAIAADHPDVQQYLRLFFPKTRFLTSRAIVTPVTTLAKWCASHSIAETTLGAAGPPPLDGALNAPPPFSFATIPGAEIVAGWDIVKTPDGLLIEDTGYLDFGLFSQTTNPHFYIADMQLAAVAWPAEVVEVDCEALFVSAPDDFHVGHFIVDFLPRLRCLGSLPADTKVILPRGVPSKFLECLAAFGVHQERIFWCDLGKRYKFSRLTIAKAGRAQYPSEDNIKFLRQAFAPARREPSDIFGYLFDRQIGTRQISNRAEVDAMMEEFGIKHIDLATLSIGEQRIALAKAKVIIGAHGSDLLACLFAPDGTHAIEMVTSVHDATREWCLQSGLTHQYLDCETAPTTALKLTKKDHDFVVDCIELRARLTAILAQTQTA